MTRQRTELGAQATGPWHAYEPGAQATGPQRARRSGGRVDPALALGALIIALALDPLTAQGQDFTDGVGREFTVFNDLAGPLEPDDAIAREFTVYNDLVGPLEPDDAIAREFTVYNDLVGPIAHTDAIGREFSVHYQLPGDLNCDGRLDFGDINPFVLALSDPSGYQLAYPHCDILNGDCNGDGYVDFDDINPFVALLTGGK